jgi:hypothetical protein
MVRILGELLTVALTARYVQVASRSSSSRGRSGPSISQSALNFKSEGTRVGYWNYPTRATESILHGMRWEVGATMVRTPAFFRSDIILPNCDCKRLATRKNERNYRNASIDHNRQPSPSSSSLCSSIFRFDGSEKACRNRLTTQNGTTLSCPTTKKIAIPTLTRKAGFV